MHTIMTDTYEQDICRLCLSAGLSNLHTHSLMEEPEILQKLWFCLQIRISVEEYLPKNICKDCYSMIEVIYEFVQKVTECDKILNCAVENKGLEKQHLKLLKFQFKVKVQDESVNSHDNYRINENIKPKEESVYTDNAELSPDQPDCEENSKPAVELAKDEQIQVDNRNPNHSLIESNESVNKTNLVFNEETESSKENVKEFKCLTCFENYDTKNLLLIHYNTTHNLTKECAKGSEYETVTSDGKNAFKCKVCDKIYSTKKAVSRHVLTHEKERPFVCKICGRTYRTASEIIRHARAHDGTRLFCRHCSYSTAYRGALAHHEKRHENEQYKYKCEKCDKGFQVKTWYLQHQNIHEGLKPFVCDICGVAFHMDRYLTTHKSSVHPQTSNLKRYMCTHCSLPCDSRKAFNEHLKEHGIKSSFLCDLCGKTLSNAEQLKFHKRMHLGVKPFSCSTCNKSFTKKFNLQLHERTHSGEKSYACERCGKHYTQRSTLQRHNMRQHPDTSRHKCSKCSKIFSTQTQLTSHQKSCS